MLQLKVLMKTLKFFILLTEQNQQQNHNCTTRSFYGRKKALLKLLSEILPPEKQVL